MATSGVLVQHRRRATPALGLVLVLSMLPAAAAQPGGDDPAELLRQIQRNMTEIEKALSGIDATGAAGRGEQIVEDLERLVSGLRSRQDQIVKDLDEILKRMKLQQSSSQSQQNQDQQQSPKSGRNQKPRARDRNQGGRQDPKDRKEGQQGQDPKDESAKRGEDPKSPENNKGKDEAEGENRAGTARRDPAGRRVDAARIIDRWGLLPEETRQRLVNDNFRDFTPEYEEEIRQYFRNLPARK